MLNFGMLALGIAVEKTGAVVAVTVIPIFWPLTPAP